MKFQNYIIGFSLAAVLFVNAQVVHLPKNVYIWERFERNPARRKSSVPYLSGDTFRGFCDHILDETKTFLDVKAIKAGDKVFVVADFLPYFFQDMYPHIDHPFILISHNRDDAVPGDFASYLNDTKIVAWFSTNIDYEHPKMHALPIGLANRCWPHGNIDIIKKCMQKQVKRSVLLCATFVEPTHTSRQQIYAYFKKVSFCRFFDQKPWEKYLKDLNRSVFVLSPRGNGLDCHRTWEALYMGAIPIVPSTTINSLYDGLPVVVVDNWQTISEHFLKNKREEFNVKSFKYEKLFANYWFNLIDTYANETRGH